MSRAKRPRFKVDEVVRTGTREFLKIDKRHLDPVDGWEYHFEGDAAWLFNFEEDLRALTAREKGGC
jgi:hypothetical protein